MKYLITTILMCFSGAADAMLAGGRPNTFSEGNNAFAGVVNPANAVWIADRFDMGAFWVHQKSSLNNRDNNPIYPPGKLNLTYGTSDLFTTDFAVHKQFKFNLCSCERDASFSLATYTMPNHTKLGTKEPIPASGTTPLKLLSRVDVISAIFSFKLNPNHALGFSIDYLHFSHKRNGFQNSDNAQRSVSPGHVTNNGIDHSEGIGCSVGWRWKITERLNFGTAWTRKSAAGQYRRYRGFEPHHAKNYVPQTLGGGFSYKFTTKIAGRLEVLWSNFGNLPGANNGLLSNGQLNRNKRGSKKSPGPGLQDATYINTGIGYKFHDRLSLGLGYSYRIKLPRSTSNFVSHSYTVQTLYNILSLGANYNYGKHDLFCVCSKGFRNRTVRTLPIEVGGGKFIGEKENIALSLSWGYKY